MPSSPGSKRGLAGALWPGRNLRFQALVFCILPGTHPAPHPISPEHRTLALGRTPAPQIPGPLSQPPTFPAKCHCPFPIPRPPPRLCPSWAPRLPFPASGLLPRPYLASLGVLPTGLVPPAQRLRPATPHCPLRSCPENMGSPHSILLACPPPPSSPALGGVRQPIRTPAPSLPRPHPAPLHARSPPSSLTALLACCSSTESGPQRPRPPPSL